MTIQAQSADGVIHEFPDGTDNAVIDKIMKDYATNQPQNKLNTNNTLLTKNINDIPNTNTYTPQIIN